MKISANQPAARHDATDRTDRPDNPAAGDFGNVNSPRDAVHTAAVTPFPARTGENRHMAPEQDTSHGQGSSSASAFTAIRPLYLLLVVALIAAVGIVTWVATRKPAAPPVMGVQSAAPLELAAVDVATVEPRVLSRALPLSGSIAPFVQATLKSKVGGEVEQFKLREGQDVREGDVIALVDTRNLQAQYDIAPGNLRDVITAGDQLRISPEVVAFFAHLKTCRLHNHYGPTETHVVTALTLTGSPTEWPAVPTIGRPIANTQIYVLDALGQPVPLGVVGEIHIGGANVARAYLDRPELTAARFLRDSFSADPQARMYRTGDLGRWRPDGTIEYLGRNDDQVKIRGFRIELAEIESRLAAHALVKEAAVMAREDVPGQKRLVAYVTARGADAPTVEALREHLQAVLPEHMIPAAFVVLQRLPLTPSGKLNRRALPAPDLEAYASPPYEAPQGEVEALLAAIWRELLHVERVGRQDNFFELGGHSLLLVQMMERLRRAGLHAKVRTVYESRTLATLAKSVAEGADEETAIPPNLISRECRAITPEMLTLLDLEAEQIERIVDTVPGGAGNVQDIYPLAPLQEGMLFHHLYDEQGGDTYIVSMLLKLPSQERLDELIRALQFVIDRHDILRTAVSWEQLPRPVQVVYRRATLPVRHMVLAEDCDPIEQITERMKAERQRLDIGRAPLMQLQVAASTHGEERYAVLRLHHVVCDHASLDTMFAEVIAHLKGAAQGLPEPMPYRIHVAQVLEHARAHDAAAFFRKKLQGIAEPTAPFELLDVHGNSSRIARLAHAPDRVLAQRIRTQARRLGVSAATLFHAAWAVVVSLTSGRDDVVFGTVLLGRMHGTAGARRVLGLFMNTLPLRLQLRDITVTQLVERTQRELIDLLSYEQASLAVVQRSSEIVGSAPLFSALLNYRWGTIDLQAEFANLGIQRLAVQSYTNYPISLSVLDQGEGFLLNVQTDRCIDPQRVMGYVSTAMQSLVDALAHAPHKSALSLSALPDDERQRVVHGFNATQADYPQDKLVHALFEEQVERTPDAIAVACGDQHLTYAQLNHRANRLAHELIAMGLRPDDRIGVHIDRSVELLVALLATLKAGGAYVPLDQTYPLERLGQMLEDSSPVVVLTRRRSDQALPPTRSRVVDIDDLTRSGEFRGNPSRDDLGLTPRNLAYVVYTSGSTGTPKGVMVEHRNLVNLVHWHCAAFDVHQACRCSCVAALGFDAAVWEIWPALSAGATLVLAPAEGRGDAEAVLDWWSAEPLDVSFLPTPIAELAFGRNVVNERLRTLLVGGDRLRHRPARQPFSLVNNYGPTESTVVGTSGCLREEDEVLHIGQPIANSQAFVLDSCLRPVPIGVAGEIYLAGASIARGYLNRPEPSAERFVANPFADDSQVRMYRTGDLGRWQPDGTIEYLGRNDYQVKIRGFRIELGEIEAQLARHEQVRDAAVIAREDLPGEKQLVAYVIARNQAGAAVLDVEALRASLKLVLPDYMVPRAFVVLERLPLTPNGKLDRRALPRPTLDAYANQQYEEPQGDVEQLLCVIWRDLLGVQQIGRQDSFFDLGGHSLLVLQLLFRANQSFGCALRVTDVYRSATLRELAVRISGEVLEDGYVDLAREATLDQDIIAKPGSPALSAAAVMLTGATGFVGRFLLAQLLEDTRAIVYCPVRASSPAEASFRLRTTLGKWDLWRDEFESRIVAIPGDLRLPRLGIDEHTYGLLAESVDTIYHCATSMNHLETYAMAAPANVGSARELLKLATRRRPVLLNYISTLSVFRSHESGKTRVVDERTSIEFEKHLASSGYVASKWVGEKMFMDAASRGVPCNIFRLGLVWADAQAGRYDELQREYRLLKSCLLSGCAIEDYRYSLPPMPVDYVARAIVYLANRHSAGRGVFHLSSDAPITEGLFERYRQIAGTTLELMPHYDWIREMKRLHEEGTSLPIVPLIQSDFSLDETTFRKRRCARAGRMRFESSRTRAELEAGGLAVPALTDALLTQCLDSMLTRDPELRELNSQGHVLRTGYDVRLNAM